MVVLIALGTVVFVLTIVVCIMNREDKEDLDDTSPIEFRPSSMGQRMRARDEMGEAR